MQKDQPRKLTLTQLRVLARLSQAGLAVKAGGLAPRTVSRAEMGLDVRDISMQAILSAIRREFKEHPEYLEDAEEPFLIPQTPDDLLKVKTEEAEEQ